MNALNCWILFAIMVAISIATAEAGKRKGNSNGNQRNRKGNGNFDGNQRNRDDPEQEADQHETDQLRMPDGCNTQKMLAKARSCRTIITETKTNNGHGLSIIGSGVLVSFLVNGEVQGEACEKIKTRIAQRCLYSEITYNGKCKADPLQTYAKGCGLDVNKDGKLFNVKDPASATVPADIATFVPDLETSQWNCLKNLRAINQLCRKDN